MKHLLKITAVIALLAGTAFAGPEPSYKKTVVEPRPEVYGLGWYGAIVAAVSDLAGAPDAPVSPAGAAAFRMLDASLREVIGSSGPGESLLADAAQGALSGTGATSSAATGGRSTGGAPAGRLAASEVVSNAAVLLFGGIETTEGMISNVILHLLQHPGQLALVREDPGLVPGAVEESLLSLIHI